MEVEETSSLTVSYTVQPPPSSAETAPGLKEAFEVSGFPEIAPEDIVFRESLGEGTFGTVYRAECRKQEVAVKVPRVQQLSNDQIDEFRKEINIMKCLSSPHVVMFLGACTIPGNIIIVTELLKTDLHRIIHADVPPSISDRFRMMKDCAMGMNWLHGISKIVHRDLKPANLLVTEKGRIKVADFGFGQFWRQDTMQDRSGPKGSALWMAPEVMLRKPFTTKIDVYSFGLILWETFSCENLFSNHRELGPFMTAVAYEFERPPFPTDPLIIRPKLQRLIRDCWAHEPSERPNFEQVLARLDDASLEYSIRDVDARVFWSRFYLSSGDLSSNEKVSWTRFAALLASETGYTDLAPLSGLLALRSTDVQGTEDVVSVSLFSQLVDWFGPFFTRHSGAAILGWMKELTHKPWFHGTISFTEASRRLGHSAPGTFLVRLSSSIPNCPMTISTMRPSNNGTAVMNKRITHTPGSNVWETKIHDVDRSFSSLFELIECPEGELLIPCHKDDGTYYLTDW